MSTKIYKKFASLERRVGETFHVANDFVRCLSHCVGEAFQNVIFYVSEVINIIYIYNLYTKNFYILISLYVKNAFKMIFIT